MRKPKIALLSSVGGHLAELLALRDAFEDCERVWVLQDKSPLFPAGERGYLVAHAERDWRVLWNFFEFAGILSRERPDVILSTGAGLALPAAVLAKLAGTPFIFVESPCCVTRLSVTGRLIRPFTARFLVQWPELARRFSGVEYRGGLF